MSSREMRPPSLRPIVLAGAAGNVVEWYDSSAGRIPGP